MRAKGAGPGAKFGEPCRRCKKKAWKCAGYLCRDCFKEVEAERKAELEKVLPGEELVILMRRVLRTSASDDVTETEKSFRRLLERRPAKFLEELKAAEKAVKQGKKEEAEPDGPDEGSERVLKLIERLTREMSDEHSGET